MDLCLKEDTLHFVQWLTPEEWQLVYGLSFVWEYEEMHSCHVQKTGGAQWRQVIRTLAREYGYEFEALAVDAEGRLWATRDEMPGEPNLLSVALIKAGGTPDYSVHVPAARRYAEARIPALDVEPLRAMEARLAAKEAEIKEWAADPPPEVKEAMRQALEQRKEAFAQMVNPEEAN